MRYFLFAAIGLSSLIFSNMPVIAVTEEDKMVIWNAMEEGRGEQYRDVVTSLHTDANNVRWKGFDSNVCTTCHR